MTRQACAAGIGAMVLVSSSCGCVPQREAIERGLSGARDLAVVAEPCLVATKAAQEQACATDAACLAEVRAHWSRMADALDAMHDAWCVLSPSAEGCDVGR